MTDGTESSLIDTNVLIYALVDTNEPPKNSQAQKLLQQCFEGKLCFSVSIQNISEFYSVVTSKLSDKMPAQIARRHCQNMIQFVGLRKLSPSPVALLKAMQFSIDTGISYWDCLLAATIIENGIFTIYTENIRDFSKIPGIKAINPFK